MNARESFEGASDDLVECYGSRQSFWGLWYLCLGLMESHRDAFWFSAYGTDVQDTTKIL